MVYFAFSEPYSYCKVLSELLDKEDDLKPSQASLITNVPRKVIGQNPQPSSTNVAAAADKDPKTASKEPQTKESGI